MPIPFRWTISPRTTLESHVTLRDLKFLWRFAIPLAA
jgi:hypothetical protein